MADLSEQQSALTVKLTGSSLAGVEDNYADVDGSGNLKVTATSAGPVTAGTVASASDLVGGQFNTSLPTLTTGQQSALQVDSSGRALVGSIASALPTGDNTIGRTKVTDGTNVGGVTATNDQKVQDTINTSLVNGNLSVGTTAVAARVGASNLANRKVLQITPVNSPLYYGAAGVTTSTGTMISTNQTITFAITANVDVFIVSANTGQNARIIEAS